MVTPRKQANRKLHGAHRLRHREPHRQTRGGFGGRTKCVNSFSALCTLTRPATFLGTFSVESSSVISHTPRGWKARHPPFAFIPLPGLKQGPVKGLHLPRQVKLLRMNALRGVVPQCLSPGESRPTPSHPSPPQHQPHDHPPIRKLPNPTTAYARLVTGHPQIRTTSLHSTSYTSSPIPRLSVFGNRTTLLT